MKRIYLFLAAISFSFTLIAQNGNIRGTVFDEANGEPLFSVTVVIEGTTNGAITDFDGKFDISAAPGIYNLKFSFISYKTITITGVEVKPGEITLIDQIGMIEDATQLEDVVVTAEAIRTTETALMTVKKKSPNLLDGISAANFRKIGDSDAAAASKRITGVSVEGGKYVFVRGLGDRYTKTQLNNMDVPGLDPDRNTLQMDIFPTNVLNNIIVSKTFTADQPADFTGGMVNIETKDIPDDKTMNIQVGLGYNLDMHFNGNYITYEGGATDFLGFDDGTRKLHISDNDALSRVDQLNFSDLTNSQLRGFNRTLSSMRETSFMDYNLGFSLGNQKESSFGTLGYNLAITYKNSTEYYENAQYSRYERVDEKDILQLQPLEIQKGDQGANNVLLGGLFGVSLKRPNSKYKINILRLQNGESRAGIFTYAADDNGSDFFGLQSNLEFSQREMTNFLIAGEHFISEGQWELKWKLSPTISSIEDPDIRFTRYRTNSTFDGGFEIGSGESGFPQRIWRDLSEVNMASRVDVIRNYDFFGESAKLKFGVSNTFKSRDFAIRTFNITIGQDQVVGDFDELFRDENLLSSSNLNGNTYDPDFKPKNANFYESSSMTNAIYVSNEFEPVNDLKAVVGLRVENFSQLYTGIGLDPVTKQRINLDNEEVIDETFLYPSVNLIYSLSENQNLRFAYSRTVARFSFKEASFASIFDPLTGRTFNGALSPTTDINGNDQWDGKIRSTLVDNFDLRWEVFQGRGQTVSVSTFYKKFHDAIEIVQSVVDNNFQPRNVGDAIVYGAEFEFRQSLGILSSTLDEFTLNGNFTWLQSEVTMTDEEFRSRQLNARTGEGVSNKRELQGQSPYIINIGTAYAGTENGLEAGIYYNIQGETLTFTGIANKPDVFTVPFHSLNFTSNYTFGENEKMRLSLKINNILNDKKELVFQNYKADDQLFQSLAPGTSISLGFRYSFF